MQEEWAVPMTQVAPGTGVVLGHQKKMEEAKENQIGLDVRIQERVKEKNLKSQEGDEKESKSHKNEHLCWK